ncbi:hypothetical protein F4778DRAFT_741230 [Xylariomycetidae sp. FL2044]|nr:hypothetical protein F4778DRAFT_741230 [Xylariomycetidae sp. FL2044]
MALPASPPPATLVPAQLGFLAIFNPSLSADDDALDQHIVYYASVTTQSHKRRHRSPENPVDSLDPDERNERLRQIGLAQGMVDFSRGFAAGKPVDTIDTQQSRVVLRELEPGWWILASIDLTKLPLPPRLGHSGSAKDDRAENVEYSSREIKPAALLMQDLLRAHSVFLLHHAASLSALFVKSRRSKFLKIVGRYWDLFLSTWDVMLHGNPATSVFSGIKMAACGELGVGVGEEDRGSGEREVLEGFVGRIEGLVDLVVSKFGPSEIESESSSSQDKNLEDGIASQWLGTGEDPGAEDGAVFLGVGALSRKSLRDVTYWMEDLYTWGEDAYGVKENVTSTRQARRARRATLGSKDGGALAAKTPDKSDRTGVTKPSAGRDQALEIGRSGEDMSIRNGAAEEGGVNKFMNYLKMGYGTHWTLGSSNNADGTIQDETPAKTLSRKENTPPMSRKSSTLSGDAGRFLIGLLGDVEEMGGSDPDDSQEHSEPNCNDPEYNSRVLLRTLTLELDGRDRPEAEFVQDLGSQETELATTRSGRKDAMDPASHFDSQDRNKTKKLRVVVYISKPFIYTFLFQNRTDSLAWDGLYRSLHYQLAPLRKPLASSTSYRPEKPETGLIASHIFDLIWDPKAMTIHSTIPNIPTPAQMHQEDAELFWSRAEAVNTHNQLLNAYIATLTDYSEVERTSKTSRGWWIVWTRILDKDPPSQPSTPGRCGSDASATSNGQLASDMSDSQSRPVMSHQSPDSSPVNRRITLAKPKPRVSKEIFLIRRAGEHTGSRGVSASFADRSGGWAEGASRLAQGIGVDTHKYIESLLSLGR